MSLQRDVSTKLCRLTSLQKLNSMNYNKQLHNMSNYSQKTNNQPHCHRTYSEIKTMDMTYNKTPLSPILDIVIKCHDYITKSTSRPTDQPDVISMEEKLLNLNLRRSTKGNLKIANKYLCCDSKHFN